MPYYRRLRDLREDHDLTQTQLVEKLNMHKTTYTNYEQGKRDLPLSVAIKIAKFYNVTLDYLAEIENE
ncbi:MAG: helix-turn-helix transcriptional regulator [Ruminococcus sp.]|nr:helix-turn-helix transcriptional regulator [Ruminococcus sp.]